MVDDHVRGRGEFIGGTGRTVFFLMAVEEETGELDGETQSIAWVARDEAVERINQTTKRLGRERDLKVLQAALATLG